MPMLREHLGSVEGFVLLGAYLSGTWMFDLMPSSYYSFEGGVNLAHVAAQMLVQDAVQAAMHLLEHKLHPKLYRASHKPHHRFLNPCLFDAFNGSVGDTVCMILVPLYITANAVHCNVWSYMAFGAAYANWCGRAPAPTPAPAPAPTPVPPATPPSRALAPLSLAGRLAGRLAGWLANALIC